MGGLDGILGNVLGSVSGVDAQAGSNPLGSILSSLTGSAGPQGGNVLGELMRLVQQQGGLGAVLDKFRQSGMAAHADSWVGTGANMPITGDQLQQVLGGSGLAGIASSLGLSGAQTNSALAGMLPELVNHLTPQGQLPANHSDLLSQALGMLGGGAR